MIIVIKIITFFPENPKNGVNREGHIDQVLDSLVAKRLRKYLQCPPDSVSKDSCMISNGILLISQQK